jgi:hypothetical protein
MSSPIGSKRKAPEELESPDTQKKSKIEFSNRCRDCNKQSNGDLCDVCRINTNGVAVPSSSSSSSADAPLELEASDSKKRINTSQPMGYLIAEIEYPAQVCFVRDFPFTPEDRKILEDGVPAGGDYDEYLQTERRFLDFVRDQPLFTAAEEWHKYLVYKIPGALSPPDVRPASHDDDAEYTSSKVVEVHSITCASCPAKFSTLQEFQEHPCVAKGRSTPQLPPASSSSSSKRLSPGSTHECAPSDVKSTSSAQVLDPVAEIKHPLQLDLTRFFEDRLCPACWNPRDERMCVCHQEPADLYNKYVSKVEKNRALPLCFPCYQYDAETCDECEVPVAVSGSSQVGHEMLFAVGAIFQYGHGLH